MCSTTFSVFIISYLSSSLSCVTFLHSLSPFFVIYQPFCNLLTSLSNPHLLFEILHPQFRLHLPPNLTNFCFIFLQISSTSSVFHVLFLTFLHALIYSLGSLFLSLGSLLSYPASSARASLSLSLSRFSRACLSPHPSCSRCNSGSDHVLPTWLSTSTAEVTHSVSGTSTCREQPRRGCRFPGSDSALERFSAACRLCNVGCVSRFYERAVPYVPARRWTRTCKSASVHARDPPAVRTFRANFRGDGCRTESRYLMLPPLIASSSEHFYIEYIYSIYIFPLKREFFRFAEKIVTSCAVFIPCMYVHIHT